MTSGIMGRPTGETPPAAPARPAGPVRPTGPARPVRPVASADDLAIAGLVPLSTVDWPGKLAATVFCQGCPWRCTYCHNTAILDPAVPGAVPFAALEALLARRHGLLDGVVLSGGEATSQHALVPAARRIRDLGFGVGLHTGGAYPTRLRALLGRDRDGRRVEDPLVDWIGFDVKAAPGGYDALVGRGGAFAKAEESLRMLLDVGIDHELRMTVTPALAGQVEAVVDLVAGLGGQGLVLQRARPDGADPVFARALGEVADWPERFAAAADVGRRRGEERGVAVSVRTG
ncbi:anaerobic ribonucleoside-triphosphate reductase activating protein [Brachybacterium sp. DNPG3]